MTGTREHSAKSYFGCVPGGTPVRLCGGEPAFLLLDLPENRLLLLGLVGVGGLVGGLLGLIGVGGLVGGLLLGLVGVGGLVDGLLLGLIGVGGLVGGLLLGLVGVGGLVDGLLLGLVGVGGLVQLDGGEIGLRVDDELLDAHVMITDRLLHLAEPRVDRCEALGLASLGLLPRGDALLTSCLTIRLPELERSHSTTEAVGTPNLGIAVERHLELGHLARDLEIGGLVLLLDIVKDDFIGGLVVLTDFQVGGLTRGGLRVIGGLACGRLSLELLLELLEHALDLDHDRAVLVSDTALAIRTHDGLVVGILLAVVALLAVDRQLDHPGLEELRAELVRLGRPLLVAPEGADGEKRGQRDHGVPVVVLASHDVLLPVGSKRKWERNPLLPPHLGTTRVHVPEG